VSDREIGRLGVGQIRVSHLMYINIIHILALQEQRVTCSEHNFTLVDRCEIRD
jgi:hypothetical protein